MSFVLDLEEISSAVEVGSGAIETGIKKTKIVDAYVKPNYFKQNELILVIGTPNEDHKGFSLKGIVIDKEIEFQGKKQENSKYKLFLELAKITNLSNNPVACKVKSYGKFVDAERFEDMIGKEVTFALQTVWGYNPKAKKAEYAVQEDVAVFQTFTADGLTVGGDSTKLAKVEKRLTDFKTKKYIEWEEAGCPDLDIASPDADNEETGF